MKTVENRKKLPDKGTHVTLKLQLCKSKIIFAERPKGNMQI